MNCDKELNHAYLNMPFITETARSDFYTYSSVKNIVNKNGQGIEEIVKCRTVGVLQSVNGQFYLSDFRKVCSEKLVKLKVSMCYVKCPLRSSVLPYPAQIFGTVQWKKEPILFAMILQVLPIKTAIRIGDTLNRIEQYFIAPANKEECGNSNNMDDG